MGSGRSDGAAASGSSSNSTCSKLVSFYLFNSTWGPREEEEALKIVYFWPEGVSLDNQLRRVGLVEGVIRFMTKFSREAAQSLHTQRERTVFLEVEPNFWLCLAVSLPWIRRPATTANGSTVVGSGEVIEFRPEEVADAVLLALLRRAYDMFCLFHGGLVRTLERSSGDRKMLSEWLDHFYSRYLGTLSVERADIVSEWGGIQYLALGAPEFLRVQSLVNRVESSMAIVRHTLFIQAGQLVWSGAGRETTRFLLHYLTTTLLPSLPAHPRPSAVGTFILGGEDNDTPPVVYIGEDTFHLVVFHALNSTLCLLVNRLPANASFYADFANSVGPALANLSADLTHAVVKKVGVGPATSGGGGGDLNRFLYFNASNMAVTQASSASSQEDSREKLVKLAADLVADLRRLGQTEGEVSAKLATEDWLVVQVAGARTIIVLLHEKNLNLMEVAEEVAKLKKSSFDNICML